MMAGLGGGAATGSSALMPMGAAGGAAAPDVKLPFPLPDWLASNQLFAAGFGLAGMGMVMSAVRVGSTAAQSALRRQLLMSMEIPSKDYSYQWVMQWLVARGVHGSRHLGVETNYVRDATSGRQTASFAFVPSPGRHWVRYKNSFILIERNRESRTVDMSTGAPWETLTLTTLALRPQLFPELLSEAKEMALEREEGKTVIYQSHGPEWRPFGQPKRVRPFSSVILDGDAAAEIYRDVQDFLDSQPWYLERGIPYRRGYLLHGPPGCGKSSYVMALAGRLGYNICILNLGDPVMTDDRLQHLLAVVPPKSLVLLEDVDFAVSPQATPDASGPYAGVMRVSFSGLLNALDGVVATEERIIFMTTNHFRALPRALVRPGRVDLSVYVGVASKLQLERMFLRFFPGSEEMSEQFATLCEGEHMSMAEVQGYFMFFKNKPDGALANVGPYLESRRKVHEEAAAAAAAAQEGEADTSSASDSSPSAAGETSAASAAESGPTAASAT